MILIAIGLAMDAFAVSLCKGLAMRHPDVKSMLIVGTWFGVFQAVMPVIGFLIASTFADATRDIAPWVAFALLALIGANMIRESFSEDEGIDDSLDFKIMLLLAIATSIDALIVGISLAMDGTNIGVAAAVIGVITFTFSFIGVKIGARFGAKYSDKAELAGGIILIALGVKVLLEHFGVL